VVPKHPHDSMILIDLLRPGLIQPFLIDLFLFGFGFGCAAEMPSAVRGVVPSRNLSRLACPFDPYSNQNAEDEINQCSHGV